MKRSRKSGVPFVKGFRRPTARQVEVAIGSKDVCFQNGEWKDKSGQTTAFFQRIPNPTSADDWLAQYVEDPQPVGEFLRTTPWLSTRKLRFLQTKFVPSGKTLRAKYPEGKVCLLPVGAFKPERSPNLEALASYTEAFFGLPVCILPAARLVEEKDGLYWEDAPCEHCETTPQRCKLTARTKEGEFAHRQLEVTSVLHVLRSLVRDRKPCCPSGGIPSDALLLIGVTMEDLFDTPPDLFVAGMAMGNARVGVFSFCRYDPWLSFSCEQWFKLRPSQRSSHQAQRLRLQKLLLRCARLLVHEIAHLLGLGHCVHYACCMNGSGHIEEDFRQPMHLCPVDLRKIHELCGVDICARYEAFLRWFKQHKMVESTAWVQARLAFVTGAEQGEGHTTSSPPPELPYLRRLRPRKRTRVV